MSSNKNGCIYYYSNGNRDELSSWGDEKEGKEGGRALRCELSKYYTIQIFLSYFFYFS